MADLGTLTKNRVRMEAETGSEFYELRQMNAIKPSPPTAKALCQFSDGLTSTALGPWSPLCIARFEHAVLAEPYSA
jgi:hypothetical protein